jgi:hypothetical protein
LKSEELVTGSEGEKTLAVVWPHEQDIDPELIEMELQPDPSGKAPLFAAEDHS